MIARGFWFVLVETANQGYFRFNAATAALTMTLTLLGMLLTTSSSCVFVLHKRLSGWCGWLLFPLYLDELDEILLARGDIRLVLECMHGQLAGYHNKQSVVSNTRNHTSIPLPRLVTPGTSLMRYL